MGTQYASLVRELRAKRGFSQLETAQKLGISRASYIAIEQGKRELTLGESEKLAEILGIPMRVLQNGEEPDYEKYRQMILAFLRINPQLPKTKLAKLLYFADFAWYYSHLKSMSGMEYRKIQYGPVADTYFRLIDEMYDSGEIDITPKDEAMLISETDAGKKDRLSKISSEEQQLITKINDKWKDKRTADIVTFTHKQMPYMFAEDNEIVSYEIFGQENPDDIY